MLGKILHRFVSGLADGTDTTLVRPSNWNDGHDLTIEEVSVTAAITLTSTGFGKMHACSGTSADYIVTLPTASGNAGRTIGVRMAAGLTKLVTVKGNGSENIDGQNTRVMWAGEAAILVSDGTGWSKIGGVTKPMVCMMRQVSTGAPNQAQSISASTLTVITINATDLDNAGGMASTGDNRIIIRRPAAYDVFGLVYYASGLSASRFLARITKNAFSAFAAETSMYAVDGYPTPSTASPYPFAKDDYIQLVGFHNASAALYTYGSTTVGSYVTAKEIPAW